MKSFATAFFKWEFHQGLWIAIDPTDKDQRWIIQPSAPHCPIHKYQLVYAYGVRPLEVEWHDNPIYLGWLAVGKKIEQTALRLSQLSYLMQEDQKAKLQDFLKSLVLPLPQGVSDDSDDLVRNPSPTENLER